MCLKCKGLSDPRVVSITNIECSFTVNFFVKIYIFFKAISEKWLNVIAEALVYLEF